MKRKELYNFIREEIVNELTVVTKDTKSDEINPIAKAEKISTSTVQNAINTAKSSGKDVNIAEIDLEEMARKANTLKVGSQEKFEAAKDLYEGSWIANLLNFILEAGEEGISQKDLAEKLGKKESSNINPAIQELKMVGAIATTRIKGDEAPEEEAPEEDDVIAVAGGEEEDKEEAEDEEDSFFKVDKEFDAPEEEPKMADIKAAEKIVPTDVDDEKIKAANAAAAIVRSIVKKIKSMKNKDAEYEKKMKALKQYIQNNRSLLTKVGTIKNITGDLIS